MAKTLSPKRLETAASVGRMTMLPHSRISKLINKGRIVPDYIARIGRGDVPLFSSDNVLNVMEKAAKEGGGE